MKEEPFCGKVEDGESAHPLRHFKAVKTNAPRLEMPGWGGKSTLRTPCSKDLSRPSFWQQFW